ncbi:sugar ABC transporter ATP-binding protein [Microbacterium aquimaris]|uniref:Sugar ABC transporter ATP-binding protein n=1 Tax=Microbacterium aquimaris TaxID=459816 RepID=A0ABU5N5E2_9MICO|nr:sugar ABC transporter ATP-binding protein [Microbacterium aquimaris]MDZ8161285.1 sugar ABC transporter ATP-binding protein [Microbacterium aquimaris]
MAAMDAATGAAMDTAAGSGLEVRDVVMSYTGVTVLKGVSIAVRPGEVIGLVGHNGAGKSTLMRVISGAIKPVSGSVLLDGEPTPLGSPIDALQAGIATVYQELSLLPNLTVAQNVFLGHERTRAGMLSKDEMRERTRALAEEFGLNVDPDAKVGTYPVATRQLLEIAIATHRNARFLLLDEPTTSLEGAQVDRFLEIVRSLSNRGIGIILVDHKLEELYAVASRVVALVDGEVRIDANVGEVSRQEIVTAIAGEEAVDLADRATRTPRVAPEHTRPVTVSVERLATSDISDVTLRAHEGRVLGIYGLVGSGRTELLRALVGLDGIRSGRVTVFGKPYAPRGPSEAMKTGVVYVTEERKIDGIVPQLDSATNAMLPVLHRAYRWGRLDRGRLSAIAAGYMDQLKVKGDRTGPVERLSGGNQQKVILARALAQQPKVLLLDEPTKGVDLGVKADIHQMVRRLAHEEGLTVIVVSSEEEEICEVSDDVVVMSNGVSDGTVLDPHTLTPASLRHAAWDAA